MLNGVHIRDLNGLEAATSQLPLIGFTVLWRLDGIRVSHSDLEQALLVTGFEKYLPDLPTPRVALRRALAEWIKTKQRNARTLQLQLGDEDQEQNGDGRRRTLIRVIDRAGSEHLVYALVAEDVDFSALGVPDADEAGFHAQRGKIGAGDQLDFNPRHLTACPVCINGAVYGPVGWSCFSGHQCCLAFTSFLVDCQKFHTAPIEIAVQIELDD